MNHPPQDPAGKAPAPGSDDPTRDVRLPPLPARPPAEARPERQSQGSAGVQNPGATGAWASREAGSTIGRSSSVAPESLSPPAPRPPSPPAAEPAQQAAKSPEAPPRLHNPVAEKPAGEPPPPREQPRERTLAFGNPRGPDARPAGPAVPGPGTPGEPAPPSGPPPWGALSAGSPPSVPVALPTERGRRWPWVVLTLLPILVIVVSGLLLIWLLRGN